MAPFELLLPSIEAGVEDWGQQMGVVGSGTGVETVVGSGTVAGNGGRWGVPARGGG